MATIQMHRPPRAAWRDATASLLLVVSVGVGAGLLTGLVVVHALGFLGLHVNTGTSDLIRKVFLR